jgi:hypothetical protein
MLNLLVVFCFALKPVLELIIMYITNYSSLLAQLEPTFDGIVIGWFFSKIVSGSCALPTRWPPQCSFVVIESSFDPGP